MFIKSCFWFFVLFVKQYKTPAPTQGGWISPRIFRLWLIVPELHGFHNLQSMKNTIFKHNQSKFSKNLLKMKYKFRMSTVSWWIGMTPFTVTMSDRWNFMQREATLRIICCDVRLLFSTYLQLALHLKRSIFFCEMHLLNIWHFSNIRTYTLCSIHSLVFAGTQHLKHHFFVLIYCLRIHDNIGTLPNRTHFVY